MRSLLIEAFKRIVAHGALDVVTADGRRYEIGDREGPLVRVRFADAGAERAMILDPELRMGELYMDGRLIIEHGTLYDLLLLLVNGARDGKVPAIAKAIGRIRRMTRWSERNNTPWRARTNVSHHYDLDEQFYRLFLDDDLQYSCAYFDKPDLGLDVAQGAKRRHIAAKLLVEPEHRVLDVGCGWGGMALYLSRIAGAREVVGVTLSAEQAAVANKRIHEAELDDHAHIEMIDYRSVRGVFDRLVSIGMFEHVGRDNYGEFFRTCGALLNGDGVMVLHTIASPEGKTPPSPWIEKYIFPGGVLPCLSEIADAVERAGLIVTDVEVLRLHYAETLRHWRERFAAHRGEAQRFYGERFCRMWEFYLSISEAIFKTGAAVVLQFQITKRQDAVPLTRDYIGQREARLRLSETKAETGDRVISEMSAAPCVDRK